MAEMWTARITGQRATIKKQAGEEKLGEPKRKHEDEKTPKSAFSQYMAEQRTFQFENISVETQRETHEKETEQNSRTCRTAMM